VDGIQRRPPTGLLFHSDRVVQYASGDFHDALQAASLVPSMSRKANGYDNAAWNPSGPPSSLGPCTARVS
jgi:transposase InsO family protein